MPIKWISTVILKAINSLLILSLDDLPIDVSGALRPPIIVLLRISTFVSINNCFLYSGACMLGVRIIATVISSSWGDPFIIT